MQPTILVVDDNPENLTVLGELLVMMPAMSGYQVLEQLRLHEQTRDRCLAPASSA